MRILVVEDEVKIRQGMSRLITSHTSHTVVGEAKNGQEGVQMAVRLRPDLILSDIRMPVMDGLEMLEELDRRGIRTHCVILSGYSEFEYARKALRFGADDYLLKPITADALTGMLDQISEKMEQEARQMIGTPEGFLQNLLLGVADAGEGSFDQFCRMARMGDGDALYLIRGYLGDVCQPYRDWCAKALGDLEAGEMCRAIVTPLEGCRELAALIIGAAEGDELTERLERRLFTVPAYAPEGQAVWALEQAGSLRELPDVAKKLKKMYDFALAFRERRIITGERLAMIRYGAYEYPREIGQRLEKAVCAGDWEELRHQADAFKERMAGMNCESHHIRHGYMRMANFLASVAQEMRPEVGKTIQDMEAIRLMGGAVTLGELERCFDRELEALTAQPEKKGDIRNYTILRALNYIREHYREGITLEETAGKLSITPEYLSTLFNKEMGMNFSAFIKQFRISHAKRLLKGTDKKIYEISAEVGYSDPKYFNRVFKEETGESPGDYRAHWL